MNLIKQAAIIFGCLAFGELIIYATGIKIPSSIIGMILLWILLSAKIVKLSDVDSVGNFLLKNMGIFLVPPCVAIMKYFGIIQQSIVPILVATIVSTLLVALSTGFTHQLLRRKK